MVGFLNYLLGSLLSFAPDYDRETPLMRMFRTEYAKDYRSMIRYGNVSDNDILMFIENQKNAA